MSCSAAALVRMGPLRPGRRVSRVPRVPGLAEVAVAAATPGHRTPCLLLLRVTPDRQPLVQQTRQQPLWGLGEDRGLRACPDHLCRHHYAPPAMVSVARLLSRTAQDWPPPAALARRPAGVSLARIPAVPSRGSAVPAVSGMPRAARPPALPSSRTPVLDDLPPMAMVPVAPAATATATAGVTVRRRRSSLLTARRDTQSLQSPPARHIVIEPTRWTRWSTFSNWRAIAAVVKPQSLGRRTWWTSSRWRRAAASS